MATPLYKEMSSKEVAMYEIADLCGVKEDTVERWCDGKTEPLPNVKKKIADYLGVEPRKLWPHDYPLYDPEADFEFVNFQLEKLHYREDYKVFQDLCRRRAALSVKMYINDSRRRASERQTAADVDEYVIPWSAGCQPAKTAIYY